MVAKSTVGTPKHIPALRSKTFRRAVCRRVHVHLGDQERDLHAGGTVFIPANTWVDIKNAGADTASVVFVFSAPGFENYMRCDSVLPNEKVTPLSIVEQKACSHQRHVVYKDLEENSKK